MAAHIEVNVFVGEELKCQVFITDEQKEIDLTTTRNDVLQVVKDFLPLNFLFTKPVGKQESTRIPVAPGQETFVKLGKCLVHDEDDLLNLYLQQTESAGKRPSITLNSPKPKRLRQQSLSINTFRLLECRRLQLQTTAQHVDECIYTQNQQ